MSSPSTILYMSFFKLSFILQSIPSDIKNSSCRLFHLTLDFITHTSLVSYPDLQCPLLQFISGRKKKKRQPQLHSQGAHCLYFSTPVNTSLV